MKSGTESQQSTSPVPLASADFDIESLVRPNIRRLEPYRCARETVQSGILLDANESPFPRQREGISLNRYPDPYQREIRDALGSYVGLNRDHVLAGAGSDEVLDWILKVFCQPGEDSVAIAEPTYGMYRVQANILGVHIFECKLNEDFDFETGPFLRAVPAEVKVLFLCSPNNPTGNLLDSSAILSLCRQWKGIVVVDEAYTEFAEAASLVNRIPEIQNLVIMRTLSKAFGRAAIRLGYAVASPAIIHYFRKVKAPYNLNSLTAAEAVSALGEAATRSRQIEIIRQERFRVASALEALPTIERVFPSEANFLLFRCNDAQAVCSALRSRGVIVRNRSGLRKLDNCVRVTVGTPEENDRFLAEIQEALGTRYE